MNILRRLKYVFLRLLVKTVGRASDGIQIAFGAGFTSGVMLEYIYRNEPGGRFLIGKWIDRLYLRHPGWEVVRTRKTNLERLLAEAVLTQKALDRAPSILDVASGPARYLLDVLAVDGMEEVRAVCRDLDEAALKMGERNAARRGLADRVSFVTGDALSAESLAHVTPPPNIGVSSGFYDWITDDEIVRRSMSLFHDVLPDGGCFLFTNQTGHVDLDMVQAVFVDFRRRPLRMVIRSNEQVNSWASDAGFDLLKTASDEKGHYSVTLAQKPLVNRERP